MDTRDPLVCVRCGRRRDAHASLDATCAKGFLEPDLRPQPERDADDAEAASRLLMRARGQRAERARTPHRIATNLPELRTHAEAMAGTPGRDYLPHETCAGCGGMPWWNGRTFKPAPHEAGCVELARIMRTDVAVTENGRVLSAIRKQSEARRSASTTARHSAARRTSGDRDDD